MDKIFIIAIRELKERLKSRSFLMMAVLGPLCILLFTYFLFVYGGESKPKWRILISDPTQVMDNKVLSKKDPVFTYDFIGSYVELKDFRDATTYQSYDAMVEINEKVLGNKTVFVFHRIKPSVKIQAKLQYQIERRLEEVMVANFTKLSVKEFRKIKQPLNFAFRNAYDPYDTSSDVRAWVGYFFGSVILLFIFLYGMTILRSISMEKSNRIVEVLLASIEPRQLLSGKIIGIGIAAFFQFLIWIGIVGIGLYFFRDLFFPDLFDASQMDFEQLQSEAMKNNNPYSFSKSEYNQFIDLVYERIQFGTMLFHFFLFFIAAYLFYSAFFTSIGAGMGSESDGQQFVLPLLIMLILALFSGYYAIHNPENQLTSFFHYFPFTSPVVVMVNLAIGYAPGTAYQLYLSLFILLLAAFFVLTFASRLYQNGILQFGHRLRLKHLFKWLKKS